MTSSLSGNTNHAYYVEAPKDYPTNPVAIRPKVQGDIILWEDTSRGKTLRVQEIKESPNRIDITTKDGLTYSLILLTKDLYDKKVKDRVMLPPSFKTDQEVQEFYLKTDFSW